MGTKKSTYFKRQVLLRLAGYDCGPCDMIWGNKSRIAWSKAKVGLECKTDRELSSVLAQYADDTHVSTLGYCAIIYFEIGDPPLTHLTHLPVSVPSDTSGVTLGVGFDLAYEPEAKRVIKEYVKNNDIAEQLMRCVGKKGNAARDCLRGRHLYVTWSIAQEIFDLYTLPRLASQTLSIFPRGSMPYDAWSMLASIVYNRGTSLEGERRREMKEISAICKAGKGYEKIPDLIRSMKRLWPKSLGGLHKRRDMEALFFEEALEGVE